MKYSELEPGDLFCIDGSRSYPKRKTEAGHIDLRDALANTSGGNPEWDVEIMLAADVEVELKR